MRHIRGIIWFQEMARAVEDGSLAVSEKDGDEVSTASGEGDMASDDEDEVTEVCVSESEEGFLEDEENSEDELIDLDSSDGEEKSDYHRKVERNGKVSHGISSMLLHCVVFVNALLYQLHYCIGMFNLSLKGRGIFIEGFLERHGMDGKTLTMLFLKY